jgi:small subunit ribosomal protein S20
LANSPQTKKRARQNDKVRLHNRSYRSSVRTCIKAFLKLIQVEDKDNAAVALKSAVSMIDKSAGKALMHKNRASRLKSRLNARLRNLVTA